MKHPKRLFSSYSERPFGAAARILMVVFAFAMWSEVARGQAPLGAAPPAPAPSAMPTTIRAPRPPGASVLARRSERSGRVRLEYELGRDSATCDSEALFRQLVASELEEPDPFVLTGPAEAVLTVRLERDPPGFRGVIEMRDMDGNVLVHNEAVERTCQDAVDRAIIMLMLRVFPLPEPPPSPPSAQPPPPGTSEELVKSLREVRARLDAQEETIEKQGEALEALRKALEEERKRKMDLTFALSTGALITANLTSNVGPGVWLGGDVRSGPLSLGLEARVVLPSPVFLEKPYDFDVSQIVALLTPCGRYSVIFGCAVAGAGVEMHYDKGAVPEMGSGPVLHIGGRLGVEVPFGESPLGARAWGEVLYSAPQAGHLTGTTDGRTLSWTRPDVSAFFGLGLVLKLGNESTKQGAR